MGGWGERENEGGDAGERADPLPLVGSRLGFTYSRLNHRQGPVNWQPPAFPDAGIVPEAPMKGILSLELAPLKGLMCCMGRGVGGLQLKLRAINCAEWRLTWGAKVWGNPLPTPEKASAWHRAASAELSSVVGSGEAGPSGSTG